MAPPYPLPSSPSAYVGLAFQATLNLMAVAMDSLAPQPLLAAALPPDAQFAFSPHMFATKASQANLNIVSAFYYRYRIEMSWLIFGPLVAMGIAGTFSFTRNFVAVFTRSGDWTRKISDTLGFGLFLSNAYLMVQLLIPLEERMGELSLVADSDDKHLEQSTVVQSLFLYHLAVLGMFFLIGVQQTVSFNHQKARKGSGGGGGKSQKNGKSNKKKKRN